MNTIDALYLAKYNPFKYGKYLADFYSELTGIEKNSLLLPILIVEKKKLQELRAVAVCQRNIRSLGLKGVRAVSAKATTFLKGATGAPVDLVLIDPPYDLSEADLTMMLTALPSRNRSPCDSGISIRDSSSAIP